MQLITLTAGVILGHWEFVEFKSEGPYQRHFLHFKSVYKPDLTIKIHLSSAMYRLSPQNPSSAVYLTDYGWLTLNYELEQTLIKMAVDLIRSENVSVELLQKECWRRSHQ